MMLSSFSGRESSLDNETTFLSKWDPFLFKLISRDTNWSISEFVSACMCNDKSGSNKELPNSYSKCFFTVAKISP